MRIIILAFLGLLAANNALTQDKYFTRDGKISFFSKAPLEDIEAHSKNGIAIFDTSNGEVISRVSIKTFDFEKDLMEEHFNENYLESDKYPHGEFKGQLVDFKREEFLEKEKSEYVVEGELTIHGRTNRLVTSITLENKNNIIQVEGSFKVLLKDHDIKIPNMVIKNIAEEILVTLSLEMSKLD